MEHLAGGRAAFFHSVNPREAVSEWGTAVACSVGLELSSEICHVCLSTTLFEGCL